MKAMILAAGLGTRLRPWTLTHPKALVPVAGRPMLERVIERLKGVGVTRFGVNVHHFADQIVDYLHRAGIESVVSDESGLLLETGGGVVRLSSMLDPEGEGFLVHNVDILSDADLRGLWEEHLHSGAGATLLVSGRQSSRRLFYDRESNLSGWCNVVSGEEKVVGTGERCGEGAFSGIYAISGNAVAEMRDLFGERPFGVMEYFLHPMRKERVRIVRDDNLRLLDIGKPETLSRAEEWLREGERRGLR